MSTAGPTAARVSYARGWDLSARRELTPLSRAEAEARDAAGEPYVVVHRASGRSVPTEVHLVAWNDSYLGVWSYDERGRRIRETDWRLLEPERLFLRYVAEWRYDTADTAEFAPDAWRAAHDLRPGVGGIRKVEPRGDRGATQVTVSDLPEEDLRRDRSEFGVRGTRGLPLPETSPGTCRDADGGTRGETAAPAVPWSPPSPARPRHLRELFEPGTRLATEYAPEMTVSAVREIGEIRLPSGRLVVEDPLRRGFDRRELAEGFRPGTYPVQAAVVAYETEYEDERFSVEDEVAFRLLLGEQAPVTWEMALAEGEDARLLRENEIFGFGTDTASGAFADAAGWEVLADGYRRYSVDGEDDAGESVGGSDWGHVRTTDEVTGGDLISFHTGGDGRHPVWLGRSAAGEPVCVVVQTDGLPDLRLR